MIMEALQGHPHRRLRRYLQAGAEAREQQRSSRDGALPAQTAGPETAGPVTARTSAGARGSAAPPRGDRPDARTGARPDGRAAKVDRKSTRLNSSHYSRSRMPSSA